MKDTVHDEMGLDWYEIWRRFVLYLFCHTFILIALFDNLFCSTVNNNSIIKYY